MGTKREYRYIQFPLCLLKETYPDPVRGLELMIAYGIVHFAIKQKYKMQEVVRQLFYDYYRNGSRMQHDLYERFGELEDGKNIIFDDNACFGRGYIFDPTDTNELEYILKHFEADPQFKEMAVLNYQLHQATEFLSAEPQSFDCLIADFNEAEANEKAFKIKYGNDAMPMCKLSQLYSFRDNPSDIALIRAYIACRSIIGRKACARTTKSVIVMRMLGAKSKVVLKDFLDENTKPIFVLYSKRYHIDKLIDTLCIRGFIMSISKKHDRHIYISVHITPAILAHRGRSIKPTRSSKDLKKEREDAGATL